MKYMFLDIETYCERDLKECGVYPYAADPSFEILLFGYSFDGSEVNVIDLAQGEKLPNDVLEAITSPDVIKIAHNALFERVCLSSYLGMPVGTYLPPEQWRCSMVASAYLGLPLSLDMLSTVLNLKNAKMKEGKELIRYFCLPCKPTKSNGMRTRNKPQDSPEKWATFALYNKYDVLAEIEILSRIKAFPMPDFLWQEWFLDQRINDRGVLIDTEFVKSAIAIDEIVSNELQTKLKDITKLENPGSVLQLKGWLLENGLAIDSLGKKDVAKLIDESDNPLIKEVLRLRLMTSKTSIKKYQAMINAQCSDERARGCFQFAGGHTLRWSGRLIQFQNMRQNHIADLDGARALVKERNVEALEMLYDDIPELLAMLIRTAIIPKKECKFIVADYSAIECRVVAYIAKEEWVLDAFRNNEDIYSSVASKMMGRVITKKTDPDARQRGKQATLSCGYGGSVGALKAMGALDFMKEEELEPLVKSWRTANPHIVKLWYDLEKAAVIAINNKTSAETHGLKYTYKSGLLFLRLPSGRDMCYVRPKVSTDDYGRNKITYESLDATHHWMRTDTFSGKLTENAVQAFARDVLANSMTNLKNYDIVMSIHDELVIECPMDTSLEFICNEMGKSPKWCSDLPLRADGYECMYYKKD